MNQNIRKMKFWGGGPSIIIPNEIIEANEFQNLYSSNQDITGNVEFPNLITINYYGLFDAFNGCTGITSVNFPKLTEIGTCGLNYAFCGCTGLTGNVEFPALISIGSNGLLNAFLNTNITEIHFKADVKSVVEAQASYSSKFGASNATIYFDL